jgi:hypothetical protein
MVIFLPKYDLNNEQVSDGVNLLISILIRYPEIGTVSFDPRYNCFKLKFMLSAILPENEFSNIKHLLTDSIAVYNMLEGQPVKTCEIQVYNHEQVSMLTIARDVYTISKNEIALIIALLQNNITKYLITDYNDSLLEEDLLIQEEVIEDMLANVKSYNTLHRLIGIRENGRVSVFSK